jgi:hypothetical protein
MTLQLATSQVDLEESSGGNPEQWIPDVDYSVGSNGLTEPATPTSTIVVMDDRSSLVDTSYQEFYLFETEICMLPHSVPALLFASILESILTQERPGSDMPVAPWDQIDPPVTNLDWRTGGQDLEQPRVIDDRLSGLFA